MRSAPSRANFRTFLDTAGRAVRLYEHRAEERMVNLGEERRAMARDGSGPPGWVIALLVVLAVVVILGGGCIRLLPLGA